MYQITQSPNQVLRIADNAFIPFDEANTDYQAYLAWLAEGNEPVSADAVLPADAPEQPNA